MDDHNRMPRPERDQAERALLAPPPPSRVAPPPRLLANGSFTWLVGAVGISQLGFWAFFVAILGQASYRFDAGPFELGILFSSFSMTFLLFTPVFGMLIDRWSPKWFLVIAQVVGIGAILVALFGDTLAWFYVASAVDGIGAAAAIPARGSLTGLLVQERELVRANGMLNMASMLAVILGPGVAGLILRHGGDTGVYWYILTTLGVGMVALLPIPDRRPRKTDDPSFFADLVAGFRFSWGHRELRALIFLASAAWFLLTVLITLEPLFVKDVLGRGVDSLGFLWAAHGAGAFIGATAITRFRKGWRREVGIIGVSLIVSGLGFLAYVGTSMWVVALCGTAVFGLGFAWFLSVSQALIQRVAAEDMRGRVTGVVGMLQEGSALVCSIGIAAIGALISTVQPFLVGSALAVVASGFYGLGAQRRVARGHERADVAREPTVAVAATDA